MAIAVETQTGKTDKRPSTAQFKVVPETRELRDRFRAESARFCKNLDRSKPPTKAEVRALAEELLRQMGLGDQYLGFTMVCVTNEFWREQIQGIPFTRRLLLLPHCLKHAEGCPADYDEFGLDCKKCGACSVADFKVRAEELGYKVLVSEGTPIVLKIIISGHVDAIVGVSCLNVLEKAFDKVLLAGIPCVAAPLLSSNCRSTSVDDDWVLELINLQTPKPETITKTYVHLMRAAHQICEEPELTRLAPRSRIGANGKAGDPLTVHENIAYDWMGQGGKRSRPFITLAAYDALKGAPALRSDDAALLPDSVRRTALAIEAFHKASLVHDDIEDDDTFRYGRETLHRQYGVGTAINVGDYLIGLGYRLVAKERKELGGDCTADILNRLSDAHLKLSEGQGAELLWRDAKDKSLTALDALKIYALKTAPAFEAALYAGVRLGCSVAAASRAAAEAPTTTTEHPALPLPLGSRQLLADNYEKAINDFSKNLGVAFQILNDLKDWDGDTDNKLIAGQDVLAARPTLLLALALEGSTPAVREELLSLLESGRTNVGARSPDHAPAQAVVERVRSIFEQTQVFNKAEKLIEKFRAKSEAVADEIEPTELRELLYFLVDSVLDRQSPSAPEPPVLQQLQLVTP